MVVAVCGGVYTLSPVLNEGINEEMNDLGPGDGLQVTQGGSEDSPSPGGQVRGSAGAVFRTAFTVLSRPLALCSFRCPHLRQAFYLP